MNRPHELQVLIAGAGPVGMMAALELARNGIKTALIDKGEGTATRSYACVLHARSVRLLERAGVGEEVLDRGTRVEHLKFAQKGVGHYDLSVTPGVIILPQSDLEEILAARLADFGVEIQWRHRLADLQAGQETVSAEIQQLWETGKGYAVPHVDGIVRKTVQLSARYVIAADGRDSHVREVLGMKRQPVGEPEYFAAYEFAVENWPNEDFWIALDDHSASLFVRLPDGRGRWLAQCEPEELNIESHLKDRLHYKIIDPAHDTATMTHLTQSLRKRVPELDLTVKEIHWHAVLQFPKSLVARFSQGHCWLVGDAAHVANPVGVQSMNMGLAEASALAAGLVDALNNGHSDTLDSLDAQFHREWTNLLDLPDNRRSAAAQALPATGEELAALLGQIQSGRKAKVLENAGS